MKIAKNCLQTEAGNLESALRHFQEVLQRSHLDSSRDGTSRCFSSLNSSILFRAQANFKLLKINSLALYTNPTLLSLCPVFLLLVWSWAWALGMSSFTTFANTFTRVYEPKSRLILPLAWKSKRVKNWSMMSNTKETRRLVFHFTVLKPRKKWQLILINHQLLSEKRNLLRPRFWSFNIKDVFEEV